MPGAGALAVMMAATVCWTLGYVLEVASTSLQAKILWAKIQYIGIETAPLALLVFAVQSSGMGQARLRNRWTQIILCVEPAVTLLLLLTNERHQLVWSRVGLQTAGRYSPLVLGHGPWFWIHALHAYFILLVVSVLLVSTAVRSPSLYRAQVAATMTAVAAPWLANIAYVSHKNPFAPLDPTPFAFVVSGLCLGWGLLRLRLLSHFLGIVPVARDAAVESMPDAMIVLDQDRRVVDLNPAATELVGLQSRKFVGQSAESLGFCDAGVQAMCGQEIGLARIEVVLGEGDSRRHFDLLVSPIKDHAGLERGRLAVFRDITGHKRTEHAFEHQALYDSLTDLPNRNHLIRRLSAVTEGSGCKPHALLLMDLDRFKEVNDTFGHECGDVLLQHVGVRLRDALSQDDLIARLGGDEFAVLLEGADEQAAIEVSARLLRSLEQPFKVEGYRLHVSVSIGISVYPQHGDAADTLMRRADVAMYAAKGSKAGYAMYSAAADPYSPDRLLLLGELRSAIARSELTLFYQPQVKMETGQVVRAEALARWRHPRLGLLLPDQFIPLAETSNLIRPLSLWAIKTALRQCREWRDAGLHLPVSVNLSAHDLVDASVIGRIPRMLKRSSLEPPCLEVEVTETALMGDPARSAQLLADLSGLGVGVAIDDFGTGHSSLAYLSRLPASAIKIDKSFVLGLRNSGSAAAIVRSTINLGHELGLAVVAEGVESSETLNLLGDMGCDFAQGYYLSHPLPALDLARWVSAWAPPRRAAAAGVRRNPRRVAAPVGQSRRKPLHPHPGV